VRFLHRNPPIFRRKGGLRRKEKNMTNIPHTISILKKQIAECEARYHREPHSVLLLAVSKTQPIEKIRWAIAGGQRAFGENYVQESLEKIALLASEYLEWHFIGVIQSNKTRKIAEHFSWVHTVSEKKIAQRLNDQRPTHFPPLNICLQINTSGESNKSGMDAKNSLQLAEYCRTLPHIKLRGLMSIPAPKNNFTEQREQFAQLAAIFHQLNERGFNLDTLSMGMSHDMEAAIAEGATIVRIGTAIFGDR